MAFTVSIVRSSNSAADDAKGELLRPSTCFSNLLLMNRHMLTSVHYFQVLRPIVQFVVVDVVNVLERFKRSTKCFAHHIAMFRYIARVWVGIGVIRHMQMAVSLVNVCAATPPSTLSTAFALVGRRSATSVNVAATARTKHLADYCRWLTHHLDTTISALIGLLHRAMIPQMGRY